MTWLDVEKNTFRCSYVMAPPMDTADGVVVTFYDTENSGASVSGNDNYIITINEDGSGTINDKAVNKGDLARLYSLLCSVNSENVTSTEGGDIVVRIQFVLEGVVRTLDLRRGESRTLIIYTDDLSNTGFSIRESYADTLHEACRAVENNEAFSTNW